MGISNLVQKYGYDNAKAFYEISLEGMRWVEAFKDKSGFKSMDLKAGTVNLSLLKTEADARNYFLKSDISFHQDVHFISKKELVDYVISSEYKSGIFSKSGFSFNPLNFLLALKDYIIAQRHNAIYENTKMMSFSETNNLCQTNLNNGCSFRAKKLFIATGG